MTQFSCVGVESNGTRSLCGLTAGSQGHNRSDPEQALSQQLTNFHKTFQKHTTLAFKVALL